jgi:hypothetical protein
MIIEMPALSDFGSVGGLIYHYLLPEGEINLARHQPKEVVY